MTSGDSQKESGGSIIMSAHEFEKLDVVARLAVHEAICGERYKSLESSINDIKALLGRAAWSFAAGLVSAVAWLTWRIFAHS